MYSHSRHSPATQNLRVPLFTKDSGHSFANVVAGWTVPETDQSLLQTYKKRDLQISRAAGTGILSFSMTHMMGVLVIQMGTAAANTIPETFYYDSHSEGKNYCTANCISAVKAFGAFKGTYLPCPQNSSTPNTSDYYFYLVKNGVTPSATIKFVSAIGQWNTIVWNTDISNTTVVSNTCYNAMVYPKWKNKGLVYRYQTTDDNILTNDHSGAGNSPHTYSIPVSGTYRIECWGAAGGYGITISNASPDNQKYHGRGAYTAGDITVTDADIIQYPNFYFYVGGRGQSPIDYNTRSKSWAGGYNGGGDGFTDTDPNDAGGGGGGATDVRLNSSLGSRIMVAGGGGGGHDTNTNSLTPQTTGMHAGGPNITNLAITGWTNAWTVTVNQRQMTNSTLSATNTFGVGLSGESRPHGNGGGGGGYWGGFANRNGITGYQGKASGGSSFVSGHSSCEGITSDNNTTPSGKNYHHSGLKFSNIVIYAGNSTMPNPSAAVKTPSLSQITSGYSTEALGHDADGCARITFFPYGK